MLDFASPCFVYIAEDGTWCGELTRDLCLMRNKSVPFPFLVPMCKAHKKQLAVLGDVATVNSIDELLMAETEEENDSPSPETR